MIHYFTYGEGSKRGIFLTTAQAEAFNHFTKSFLDAQLAFLGKYGRAWTPSDAFYMPFGGPGQLRDNAELDLYNRTTKLADKQYWVRNRLLRRPVKEKHVTGDYLVQKI